MYEYTDVDATGRGYGRRPAVNQYCAVVFSRITRITVGSSQVFRGAGNASDDRYLTR